MNDALFQKLSEIHPTLRIMRFCSKCKRIMSISHTESVFFPIETKWICDRCAEVETEKAKTEKELRKLEQIELIQTAIMRMNNG